MTFLLVLTVCVALAGCGDDAMPPRGDVVTLQFLGPDASTTLEGADDLLFAGWLSARLPIDNPAPALGTNHTEDERAQARIDAFLAAVDGADRLIVRRGAVGPGGGGEPIYQLSGCVENNVILAEVERLGGAVCDPSVLGRAITFANVQLARVAPNGPYHIYDDYVIQTLPLFLDTGGCVAGAWLCESDDSGFDGIFIPAYQSEGDILQVARQTSASGPGGSYGDATYADLRLGGVEIVVRNLVDVLMIDG